MNKIDQTFSDDENKNEFDKNIKSAVADIEKYINENIYKPGNISINYQPTCINDISSAGDTSDLYLSMELSGYGSIKTEWKKIFIATGIIEGVIQGVAVAIATQNNWVGLGVAGEEVVQEYLSLNGVDWFLGESYAPVTLEGKLVYAKQKKVIWQESYFVTENEDELSDEDKKNKSKQLEASLHEAEKKLVTSLNDYLQKISQEPVR